MQPLFQHNERLQVLNAIIMKASASPVVTLRFWLRMPQNRSTTAASFVQTTAAQQRASGIVITVPHRHQLIIVSQAPHVLAGAGACGDGGGGMPSTAGKTPPQQHVILSVTHHSPNRMPNTHTLVLRNNSSTSQSPHAYSGGLASKLNTVWKNQQASTQATLTADLLDDHCFLLLELLVIVCVHTRECDGFSPQHTQHPRSVLQQ